MTTLKLISLIGMSALYCTAGIFHYLKPKFFIDVTPKWVPYPTKVNIIVGTIEIILSIALLFSFSRSIAAIGVIVLLIAVFPANIYHFQQSLKKNEHVMLTLIRLPIQILLIYWAYTFI